MEKNQIKSNETQRKTAGRVLTVVFKQMRAHRKMQLEETGGRSWGGRVAPPRPCVTLPASSSLKCLIVPLWIQLIGFNDSRAPQAPVNDAAPPLGCLPIQRGCFPQGWGESGVGAVG